MIRLLLAGEDASHHAACTRLFDRVLATQDSTPRSADDSETSLDPLRTWADHRGRRYIDVHSAFEEARARRLPIRGHFDGQPAAPEAHLWRAVFHLALDRPDVPDVVVAARDDDGHAVRADGLEQARSLKWPFLIVRAIATQEVEAWWMAGFDPMDAEERRELAHAAKQLGFDPREQSERLTGGTARDAKRLLEHLTRADPDRRATCLETPLEILETRGSGNGLEQFLRESREALRSATPA